MLQLWPAVTREPTAWGSPILTQQNYTGKKACIGTSINGTLSGQADTCIRHEAASSPQYKHMPAR